MKHIHTFESFLNEAVTKFKEGDLVRWSNPKAVERTPALYGVIVNDGGKTVDIAVVGTSSHTDTQPTTTNMVRNNYPTWKGGEMSADELEKGSEYTHRNADKKFLTIWANGSSVNEKRSIGFFGLSAMDLFNKISLMSRYHTVKKGEKARVLVDGKRYWVTDLQELERDPRAKTVIVTDKKGEEVEFEISEIQEIEMG